MIRRLGARTRLTRPPVRQPAGPPPLTEAEAAEAEAQLGVVLPPEYRRHLLEVSAGGETFARLERTADGWWWTHNTAMRRDLLALPFPHPDSYKEADEALARREPRIEDHPDEEAYDRAMTAWDDEAGEFEDRKTAGAVVIKEHGCGFATLLAVTGPLAKHRLVGRPGHLRPDPPALPEPRDGRPPRHLRRVAGARFLEPAPAGLVTGARLGRGGVRSRARRCLKSA